MEEMLNVFFVFIIFSLLLIFTLVAARIILTAAIKCQCFSLLSESTWTLKLSRKKESASLLLFFLFLGVRRFTFRHGRVLEMQNSTPAYVKGYTCVLTRTDDFLRTKIYGMHR